MVKRHILPTTQLLQRNLLLNNPATGIYHRNPLEMPNKKKRVTHSFFWVTLQLFIYNSDICYLSLLIIASITATAVTFTISRTELSKSIK